MLDLYKLLKNEIQPALGCTEPAAVALACAIAASHIDDAPQKIEVHTDPNIFKNGMGVYIPGTEQTGLYYAASLGALSARPELELEVLKGCEGNLNQAENLINEGRVAVSPDRPIGRLSILAHVSNAAGRSATVLIEEAHTNVVKIEVDGKVIHENKNDALDETQGSDPALLLNYSIKELIDRCQRLPEEAYQFLLATAENNFEVGQVGLEKQLGLKAGWHYQQLILSGQMADDMSNRILVATTAAADARMSGYEKTVYSVNGSGNQGITASVPVLVAGRYLNLPQKQIAIALAISQTLTIYAKQRIGKLSALCACTVAAGLGAGAGIAYLLGATEQKIEETIKLMVANISGVICDGAKTGCSLKIATAVRAAAQAAQLAKQGLEARDNDGIIAPTLEATLYNLGLISIPGMIETDETILKIMMNNSGSVLC